jgi:putative sigma-54 modulation protein
VHPVPCVGQAPDVDLDTVNACERSTRFFAFQELAMQTSISVRHGELQPGDQPLIEEKVAKLRRLFDRISAIEVIIDLKQLDRPWVEIKVSAEHASTCVASAEATTVISALDLALPKVEQQLRKTKEKLTGHRSAGHKHMESGSDAQ